MWLIGASMRRPVTILIAVLAIMLASVLAVKSMKKDIFPDLDIPAIYIIEGYGGMSPAQMEGFLTSVFEIYMLYVPGVEHIESRSIQNLLMIKLFFQPGTDMSEAVSTSVAMVDRARSLMPEGTLMPFVFRFDAGSLPVGQLVLSSPTRTIDELQDLAYVRVRSQLGSVPGASAPPPEGGNVRSIVVNVDTDKMRRYNLSGHDVSEALAKGNFITPAGNVRTGDFMRMAPINTDLPEIDDLLDMPVKLGPGPTVFIRDIATVDDSSDILAGYAMFNGKRTVYMPVIKRADASTLEVVEGVLAELPHMQSLLPADVKLSYVFDQSNHVTDAINDVVQEGVLGAILPGVMILLFLRDIRSTLVVVTTIPCAIMSAIVLLYFTRQTINIQTLSGLALAIGILVDEATVNIENIHVHLGRGEPITRAVFNAGVETMVPRFLAMMSVLAVFVPSFFMTGITKHLFVPLSLAVGFAMASSFLLSSTLVPVMSVWLVKAQHEADGEGPFKKFQNAHRSMVEFFMKLKVIIIPAYLVAAGVLTVIFFSQIGREMFPDAGGNQFQLRIRAPVGTRVEVLEAVFNKTIAEIKDAAGPNNVKATLGYAGQQAPQFVISSVFLWTSGPHEGVLDVALKEEAKIDINQFKETLRKRFAEKMPNISYSFEPGDLVSQIMNLGSPTPISVMVSGPDLTQSRLFAEKVKAEMAKIPYLRDLQYGQPLDYPTVDINMNRELAGQFGITPEDLGRSLLPATYSSRYMLLNFWFDRKSGVSYQVQVQVPQDQMASLEDVKKFPVMKDHLQHPLVGDVADVSYGTTPGEYDRYNMMRFVTLTANIHGKDLGNVGKMVATAIRKAGTPPRGVSATIQAQVPVLQDTFNHLFVGLGLAVVVIFLMLTAYFQSPRLALTVLSTSPAIVLGVVVTLFCTGTTLNVQSFMGAIMSIGVGVSNAILLVAFAENNRLQGMSAEEAALHGASERLRPILMTSIAMVSGMVPMALALGGGGQMAAPLGRAVIGGLTMSTVSALTILPLVFSLIQSGASLESPSLHPDDRGE